MIAAFIDFQGTIGGDGLDNIDKLKLCPYSIEAIKMLNDNKILVIGITGQSGIEKGKLSMDDYEAHLKRLEDELDEHDAFIDAVYCCPHHLTDCDCKKPKRGMIDMALQRFDIDIEKSFVVGDMGDADMLLAKNIGAKAILVLTGVGKGSLGAFRDKWANFDPDFIAENILHAANFILTSLGSS